MDMYWHNHKIHQDKVVRELLSNKCFELNETRTEWLMNSVVHLKCPEHNHQPSKVNE